MSETLTDFKSERQWVAWRNEKRNNAPTKVPYAARRQQAKADDPTTWLTHDKAVTVAEDISNGDGGGIGIVLGRCDNVWLAGVDLDTCRDPRTGLIEPWAQSVLDRLATYSEVSPSDTGVKAFFRVDPADVKALRGTMCAQHGRQFKRTNGGKHPPAIELYISHRYFAVTWRELDGWPEELRLVPLEDLRWLLEDMGPAFAGRVNTDHATGNNTPEAILDRLDRAAASNKAVAAALRGAATLKGGSRSEGALGLGAAVVRSGWSRDDMKAALLACPAPRDWATEKLAEGDRQFERIWQKARGEDKRAPRQTPSTAATERTQFRRAPNLLMLAEYIEALPRWTGAVRLNDFTQCIEVRDPFPPPEGSPRSGMIRTLREPGDVLEVVRTLQEEGFAKAGKALVSDVLAHIAQRNSYHPVRDYLRALKWDEKPRLGRLFQYYFNAEMPQETEHQEHDEVTAYLEHVSWCWGVSAVARIEVPGCKVDHLPILVGDQGFGKGKAIRALCSDEAWFSDDLAADVSDRDTKDSLTGKWIIELSEMPHVRKEVERIKAFFSRQTDRYRRAYDRLTNDWPRQCVFIGSSNDLVLIDATGNRRFWPVRVDGNIDPDRIRLDRDQLWAEAVHLYDEGYKWWLPPNIERIARKQQDEFGEDDIWISHLDHWTEMRRGVPFTLEQAMTGALGFLEATRIDKRDQGRASQCLKTLGFRGRRRRVQNVRASWWSRPTPRAK